MPPDAITLLRELRPPDPALTPDEAALARIVATPPERPPRRHRRRALRPALALATAAVAAALVVVPGGSPDVLAQTAAALTDEDTILHFRTETRHRSQGAELDALVPDGTVDARAEGWQADGGRRERMVFDGGDEIARDWDAEIALGYNAERDEIIRHPDMDSFWPITKPSGIDDPSVLRGSVIVDLSRLLERARRGEENVRLVGETSVRGIDVYELRIDFGAERLFAPRADGAEESAVPVRASRTVYVDRERFLPVRIEERSDWPALGGEVTHSITDYLEFERLPRTPENEKLLELSPHPGAKEVPGA